ncbi:MAG: phage tail protein [Myxococcales bacterium]|nr:phage tail protein [Myxococcales bacterium]
MAVERNDPYISFNYLVEIAGLGSGGFSEVSGLDVEVQPIDYRNGDEDFVPRKLPGLKRFPNLILKRGIIGKTDVFDWVRRTAEGQVDRREGAIVLRDEQRREVFRWRFVRGWACKYSGPTLSGDSNTVALETIEICHEGLTAS